MKKILAQLLQWLAFSRKRTVNSGPSADCICGCGRKAVYESVCGTKVCIRHCEDTKCQKFVTKWAVEKGLSYESVFALLKRKAVYGFR